MRTYGRITNTDGSQTWVEVDSSASDNDDAVYLTTLAQVLKLNLGESPFYGNYGIPQYQTIVTQVFPDYYVAQTQMLMAPFFAALTINRVSGSPDVTYNVNVTLHSGAQVSTSVPT